MQILPPALTDLIEAFGLLPGVGPRTAERYAYHLIKQNNDTPERLADALTSLKSGISYCRKTFALGPAAQQEDCRGGDRAVRCRGPGKDRPI
jgi:recombination protein RecR